MGVKYLNRFVHRYPIPLLENIEVSNASIVIDGSELLYHMYFELGQLSVRCGGEYDELRRLMNDFIDVMNNCSINCVVVFDSFKSENNIPRYLKTRSEKLARLRRLVDHGESDVRVQPLLGKNVLKQTLFDAGVPFLIVPGDADAEIAAIANGRDAFVLAGDTDFCIFDLKRGLLTMDDFDWKNAQESSSSTCRGKVFRREILHTTFGTPLQAIAFLEPLLSNQDGVAGVDFMDFVKNVQREVHVPQNLRRLKYRRPDYIESLLLWLKDKYRTDEQTIGLIKQKVPSLPEDKFIECIRGFNELPDVRAYGSCLEQGGHDPSAGFSCFGQAEGLWVPACFLSIMPDDQSLPSCSQAGARIRNAIYQIGFFRKNVQGNGLRVVEADRSGCDYRSSVITVDLDKESMRPMMPDLEPDEYVQHEDYADIKEARRAFILEAVSYSDNQQEVEELGEGNRLLAMTLKYWASLQDQSPPEKIRVALAITISCVYHDLQMPEALRSISDECFDKSALHFSSQWQVCIYEAILLNNILGCPFVAPEVGKLFSGRKLQKAYEFLLTNADLPTEDVAYTLFGSNVDVRDFFNNILRLLDM